MVGLHVGWLDVLKEVGPMLELVEVDRGMRTWGMGVVRQTHGDSLPGALFQVILSDKIHRSKADFNLDSGMGSPG